MRKYLTISPCSELRVLAMPFSRAKKASSNVFQDPDVFRVFAFPSDFQTEKIPEQVLCLQHILLLITATYLLELLLNEFDI